jgi:hypothetical protein
MLLLVAECTSIVRKNLYGMFRCILLKKVDREIGTNTPLTTNESQQREKGKAPINDRPKTEKQEVDQ